jgi:hypothetical protein
MLNDMTVNGLPVGYEYLNEGGEKGILSVICIAFLFHGALLVIEPI